MTTLYTLETVAPAAPLFADILALRAAAYGRAAAGVADEFDAHSLHFVARDARGLLGALRVTCRWHGPLESEHHYPGWLLEEYGSVLCAVSRLCVRPDLAMNDVPLRLSRFACASVLPLGVRLDVTKARLKAVPFYLRLGYLFLRGSVFDYERWDARCALIARPADPRVPGPLADLFAELPDPCRLRQTPAWRHFTSSYQEFAAEAKAAREGSACSG